MDQVINYVRRIVPATETEFLIPAVAAPYVGPGDIVASSSGWWGLRGYSNAYSTGSNPAIDVVDTATGLITTTINILSTGDLDVASIAALGYGVSIKKWYDQSGTGNHMTQATLANMMTVTLNAIGSRPGAASTASQFYSVTLSPGVGAMPWSISNVMEWQTPANGVVWEDQFDNEGGNHSTDNNISILAGGVAQINATSSHGNRIYQFVYNSGSSAIYVDGVATTGTVVPCSIVNPLKMGSSFGSTTAPFYYEMGLWASAFSATDAANMDSNQRTYWGF